jgi:hypothetical protein
VAVEFEETMDHDAYRTFVHVRALVRRVTVRRDRWTNTVEEGSPWSAMTWSSLEAEQRASTR